MSMISDTHPPAALDTEASEREKSATTWLQTSRREDLALADTAPGWIFNDGDELFRGIYTRAGTGFANEVLAVCSAISGEGRTTVSVGLAVTIAQDFPARRVLLVETDLPRSVLAEDFGVDANPGLIDCLVSGEPLQNACRPTFLDNLHIVPAGNRTAVP
ncbi:MAG TPA: hypothetical protein VF937_17660, partial [Chloroflexota bacterium]